MKKAALAVVFIAAALFAYTQRPAAPVSDSLQTAIANRARDVAVEGSGTVTRILPDDREGSRHQRFLVRLDSGTTVLISHNIDVAPRVPSLRTGDTIVFAGEYIWNDKGGLVHWTHRDRGWLEHKGQTYQ